MAATANATTGIADLNDRTLIRLTQALQDAIVFRRARAGAYCHDCAQAADGRCDDHHCDLELIASYERDIQAIDGILDHRPAPPDEQNALLIVSSTRQGPTRERAPK